jgi:hypothetical protein
MKYKVGDRLVPIDKLSRHCKLLVITELKPPHYMASAPLDQISGSYIRLGSVLEEKFHLEEDYIIDRVLIKYEDGL